jgi:hypothetical protein
VRSDTHLDLAEATAAEDGVNRTQAPVSTRDGEERPGMPGKKDAWAWAISNEKQPSFPVALEKESEPNDCDNQGR